jgi:hypothetical protein
VVGQEREEEGEGGKEIVKGKWIAFLYESIKFIDLPPPP